LSILFFFDNKLYNFLILLLLIVWVYISVLAKRRNTPFPWRYSFFLFGILSLNFSVRISGSVEIGSVMIILLIFGFFTRKNRQTFYIRSKGLWRSVVVGFLIGLFLFLIQLFFLYLREPNSIHIGIKPLDTWVITVISQVIGEEVLLRGYLLSILIYYGMKKPLSNYLQAGIFAIAHFPRYLPTHNYVALFIVALLGISAGYLTYKKENIFGAISMHGILNVLNRIILL
jgi:membrane protease YdiL (CAAX protease family)